MGAIMKFLPKIVAVAVAIAWTFLSCESNLAQNRLELTNRKVEFAYIPPKTAALYPIMDRLKKRQYLEQLSEFVSPVRLPHPFTMVTLECGMVNAFYSPDQWAIVLCYEWIDLLDKIAPKQGQPVGGITRDDVIIGATTATVIHELGHAMFDMLQVPVFGREEDAADQMAIFIAMQFSKDVALRIVKGFAYFWNAMGNPKEWTQWADEHGTAAQRLYNALCLAYGGDAAGYKGFVDSGILPAGRAANCANEYQQVRSAFTKTVLPFIDPDMMKAVQAKDWSQPLGVR
jgi:hypothetical protein